MGEYIKNNKSVTAKLQKSRVYKLKCGLSPMLYIGKTGRLFEVRMHEHSRGYRLENGKLNYAAHVLDANHVYIMMILNYYMSQTQV